MKRYTLGFLFSKDLKKVLLIHKNRPEWQMGKVNGLGGKIEENETPQDCITREVQEETGLSTKNADWQLAGTLHSSIFETSVLFATYQDSFGKETSQTDEIIEWFSIKDLPTSIMSNLSWLIPLCLDRKENTQEPFTIDVQYDI
ncbi:MAG TPA: NUDIX domain-containing protein [Candidatus Eisenbacteria bacterium]|nr:NUDIX domain-containing protein [Candidatus Eisenbacteria bacterium]